MFQVTFFNPVIERGRRLQRQKKVFSKQHGMLQCSHTTFLYPRLDFKIFFPACCFSCFTFFWQADQTCTCSAAPSTCGKRDLNPPVNKRMRSVCVLSHHRWLYQSVTAICHSDMDPFCMIAPHGFIQTYSEHTDGKYTKWCIMHEVRVFLTAAVFWSCLNN